MTTQNTTQNAMQNTPQNTTQTTKLNREFCFDGQAVQSCDS
jgi:hypothetical protein